MRHVFVFNSVVTVFVCLFLQAQASLSESSQRLDLIRHSLELRNKELPPQQSAKAMELKKELDSYTVASPTPSGGSSYVSLQPFRYQQHGGAHGDTPTSSSTSSSHLLGKSAAITGKLEVRLMGCQDLLEDVPGRSRRDSAHSGPNDLKSFVKGMSPELVFFFLFRINDGCRPKLEGAMGQGYSVHHRYKLNQKIFIP